MLYPLLFIPAMKDYLWGGRGLEKIGKTLPEGIVAESWEISGHPDGLGKVANGRLAGLTLPELLKEYGRDLVGTALPESAMTSFPLLVKFIDANDRLSVQVHPDDAYARVHENGSLGKTEMWVVLDAKPGSKLVYGLKRGVTREQFAKAVEEDGIASCLNEIPARKGDVFDIPAGLVHAIGSGLMMVEIQQNSNATYRVYDYGRVDSSGNRRPLHIGKAMDVIDFTRVPGAAPDAAASTNRLGATLTTLVANKYFVVERCEVDGMLVGKADGSRFEIVILLEGSALMDYPDGMMRVRMGDSMLLPAMLGSYCLRGQFSALRTWVPHGNGG
jgi:mannose-6-phosphate isomerase